MNQHNQTKQQDTEGEFTDSDSYGSKDYTIIDSKKLRKKIILEKIYPFYLEEVDSTLLQIKYWSKTYEIFSATTAIMISATTIISFSAPQFPDIHYISYMAGILGVCALACERFTHYCSTQASASTQRTNILLESIGIKDTIPDTQNLKINDEITSPENNQTNNLASNQINNSVNKSDIV